MLRIYVTLLLFTYSIFCTTLPLAKLSEKTCVPTLGENGEIDLIKANNKFKHDRVQDGASTYSVYLSDNDGYYALIRESYTQDKTTLIVPLTSNCENAFFDHFIYLTRTISVLKSRAEWLGADVELESKRINGAFEWNTYMSKGEKSTANFENTGNFEHFDLANEYGVGVKLRTISERTSLSKNGVLFFPTNMSGGNIPIELVSCVSGCADTTPILYVDKKIYRFAGMMDRKIPFEMAISKDGSKISGKYRYTKNSNSMWINLSGHIENGKVRLKEDFASKVTGVFTADVSKNYIVGIWKSDSKGKVPEHRFLAARRL